MQNISLDIETRSSIDLTQVGAYRYAEHPDTEITLISIRFSEEEAALYCPVRPELSTISKQRLTEILNDKNVRIYAYNLEFEYALWNEKMHKKRGFPALDLDRCSCTMAVAIMMGFPRSLANACAAIGIEQGKDIEGKNLMMKMAKPIDTSNQSEMFEQKFIEDEKSLRRLGEYCHQDTLIEMQLMKRLKTYAKFILPTERDVWLLDKRINKTGFLVDRDLVTIINQLVECDSEETLKEFQHLTKGMVESPDQKEKYILWLEHNGYKIADLTKARVCKALNETTGIVKQSLLLRQRIACKSVKKFIAAEHRICNDNRIKGSLVYHGASTGRWTGVGYQPQNLARDSFKDDTIPIELIKNDTTTLKVMYGHYIEVCKKLTRSVITAPDNSWLVVSDFSSIEGRVLAWLAGEKNILNMYREGIDLYKINAATIYGKLPQDVDKSERQIGKVAELALGYQGGANAFHSMAANYGVSVSDNDANKIKNAWRKSRQPTVAYWNRLNKYVTQVIQTGQPVHYNNTSILLSDDRKFLLIRLPSGRHLFYYEPKIKMVMTPWGKETLQVTYMGVDTFTKKWKRISTYGGKLAENITQAVARDLLSDALLRVARAGHKIVMHVHDEIVVESSTLEHEELSAIMAQSSSIYEGLPIKAEGFKTKRYKK